MAIGQWLGLFSLGLSLYILWQIRQILLLVFAAIVLATALNKLARKLQHRLKLSRPQGVLAAIAIFMAILIGFSILQHAPYSVMTTTIYSALADIADENELKYGIRQEGVLYSTRTFFARIDQALGTALAGWVLAFIAFPAKAVPGAVDPAILTNLALATVLSTIPGLFAAASYAFLKVTRATHDATRAALDARAAEAAG